MKHFLHIILLLMLTVGLQAQHVQVMAPRHVAVGEEFQIEYTINTRDVRNFRMGNLPNGLECLYGPSTSEQSNIQFINGHTTSSSSVSVAYVLRARRSGTFTIPPARFHTGGMDLASTPIKIVASGGTHAAQGNGGNAYYEEEEEDESRKQQVSNGNELFIKVIANKTNVHEQEAVLLTYKVYTNVNLVQLDGKMPDLTGFHVQEIKLPQQKSFQTETYNGRRYKCVTWSQYVMYPQITGKLQIPPITFHGIVREENRDIDPFEAFSNGAGYRESRRDIKAQGVTINVSPLPTKPANFSGGVGTFNISGQIDKKEVKAGEPVNLRIVIGGTGNLKLIKQPKADFPNSFDQYNPKFTDKTRLTASGIEGNVVYDLLFVPRQEGNFTIPPVSFTYYDTKAGQYKTIKTQAFKLKVGKGDGTGSVSDFTEGEGDIRPIKTGKAMLENNDDLFFASVAWWSILIALLAIMASLFFIFRKRSQTPPDHTHTKRKNANKVATQRMQRANSLMQQGLSGEFFDEVLHALWEYIGDRLNMPAEQLNRDNISESLTNSGVDQDTIARFINAIDECEFERYAPGDAKGNMSRTIEAAITAITQIEDAMEKKPKDKSDKLRKLFIAILLLSATLQAMAVTKQMGDQEYQKGNYSQAVKDYTELLQHGASSDIYYNLGNAYYRLDDIPHAILSYERALLLTPGDADVRFNLQMARAKTIDKITPQSELFFVTGWRALVNLMSVDAWATLSLFALILSIIFALIHFASSNTRRRKAGLWLASTFFAVFLLATLFAWQQKHQLECHCAAIVMSCSAAVKKSPEASSPDHFVIHEGTKVFVQDRGISQWRLIRLEDGREGWIKTKQIEEI